MDVGRRPRQLPPQGPALKTIHNKTKYKCDFGIFLPIFSPHSRLPRSADVRSCQCMEKPQKDFDQAMLKAILSILDDKHPLISNVQSPCKSCSL
ncbi:hypothetical protein Agabi119p4_2659 [Agaricus bisporus var. burnettii]|uniref:Uncharacterized protein n=1 Tax=Agaricus bisporus var. burnettii TaxID=192524 RepID=A0A8H7F9L3_AGABI|nr:hypothetical protein Agabi119p4_2659 [Agaricus bisporus var. burnettii]